MKKNIWFLELPLLALYLIPAMVLGWFFDYFWLAVSLAFGMIIVRQFKNIELISDWLIDPKYNLPPDNSGAWENLAYQLYQREQRHRKRKKKLAKILAEFQASTAALPDAGIVLNKTHQIMWFNEAAEHYLGLQRGKDQHQDIRFLLRNPEFIHYLDTQNFEGNIEINSPIKNNIILSIRIIPYGKNQQLLLARDVSDIRRTEAMRRDFFANASHELRTPLTVLYGWLEMLDNQISPDQKELVLPIQEMRAQTHRMRGLIENMLKLSQLESANKNPIKNPINIYALISKILSEAQQLSKKKHQFQLHFNLPKNYLYSSKEQDLHSIFGNIIFNAVQYTPEKQSIYIELGREKIAEQYWLYCRVKDEGIGIAQGHLSRLTERFYRVDSGRSREIGGTGLGLAIVKHALENYGGYLKIKSELGKGSTFTAWLPE